MLLTGCFINKFLNIYYTHFVISNFLWTSISNKFILYWQRFCNLVILLFPSVWRNHTFYKILLYIVVQKRIVVKCYFFLLKWYYCAFLQLWCFNSILSQCIVARPIFLWEPQKKTFVKASSQKKEILGRRLNKLWKFLFLLWSSEQNWN